MNKKKAGLFFLIICLVFLVSYLVFALTSVSVVSPSSNTVVSGNILLNTTVTNTSEDEIIVNVTFMWENALTSGDFVLNTTIFNDTEIDRVFENNSFSTTNLVDGTYNLTVIAYNSTGESVQDTSVVNVTVDNTQPFITIQSPQNKTYNNATLWINVSADETISTWILNWNGTNETFTPNTTKTFTEGQHNLTIYANDTAGNWNTSYVMFTVDTTPPFIKIDYPQNTTYTTNITYMNYTVDSTAVYCWYSTDSGATNNSITCGQNISDLAGAEGQNLWYIYTNDTLGNENSTYVQFFIDNTPPFIQYNAQTTRQANWSQDFIQVNVTATDTYLTNITIYLYNTTDLVNSTTGSTSPLFINFTGLKEETYYINASANDTVGNTNYTSTRTITLDLTSPNITIIRPQNITYNNVTLWINVTANETISNWILNFNGTNQSFSPNITFSFNELQHTLIIYANDSANNWVNSTVTFTIKDFPNISLMAPADGYSTTSKLITFKYNVSDMSDIVNCSLIINGVIAITNTSITKEIEQNFTYTLGIGTYSWRINCTDSVGYYANSSLRTLKVISSSSSSSSSSGGGGAAYTAEFVLGSKKVSLNYGDVFIFKIKKQRHTVIVKSVKQDSVTIRISSDPIDVTLKEGETKELDLDGNGLNDFSVTLNKITKLGGDFTFAILEEKEKVEKISEEEIVEEEVKEEEELVEEVKEEEKIEETPLEEVKEKKNYWWVVISIIALIIIIAIVVKQKNK